MRPRAANCLIDGQSPTAEKSFGAPPQRIRIGCLLFLPPQPGSRIGNKIGVHHEKEAKQSGLPPQKSKLRKQAFYKRGFNEGLYRE
ncbi:hypothetical protein [Neisseria sp. oral taxon 020]|uniref:hypothetical protein n=1 Tax=Neisseria sp. oral taxon 020 TaxID=712401 RepID=UPI000344EA56|nr:hypothetical protein [Neisseria sp. oral taxon 020]